MRPMTTTQIIHDLGSWMREGFAALIQAAAEWRHVGHRDLRVTGFRYMSPRVPSCPAFPNYRRM